MPPRRHLPDWVEVRKSPIHGRGCFAVKKIRKGTYIGSYEGKSTEEDDTYVLWIDDGKGGWTGVDGKNELRFVNHSPDPNATFEGVELYALRTIYPGDEITFHYGDEWAAEHDSS